MNWRRLPELRRKMIAVRKAVLGRREGGGESEEAQAQPGAEAALAEADRQSMSLSAQALIRDIREAHRDWINAHRHFEYAAGFDQIDYAIYAIEAAEKRYEMLLRQAKKLNVHWRIEWEKGAGAG
jgi:Protein of unknown function (DUF2508).